MFITRDNQRLYVLTWDYNAARTISRLAEIVKEKGGRVAPSHPAIISCRRDPAAPIVTVTHSTYISFILDGFYYYYQVSDNPFFEFIYSKAPTDGYRVDQSYYAEEAPKNHFSDDFFFKRGVSPEEINEAAEKIFSFLLSSKPSKRYTREAARWKKIDF